VPRPFRHRAYCLEAPLYSANGRRLVVIELALTARTDRENRAILQNGESIRRKTVPSTRVSRARRFRAGPARGHPIPGPFGGSPDRACIVGQRSLRC